MILLASLFFLSPAPPLDWDSTPRQRIEAAIARIPAHLATGFSEEVEESLTVILRVLYRDPAVATGALIERLEPARPGMHYHDDHPTVVWYVRALRSLTGLDFTAPTTQLADSEAGYLQRDSVGNVRLFGWEMGWDRTWVAPEDAQRTIIQKWRTWFGKEGRGFKYVNDPDHEHWYF